MQPNTQTRSIAWSQIGCRPRAARLVVVVLVLPYQEMLRSYRSELQRVGLDLDSETAEIAPVAQRWAAARMKRGGGEVSPATYNQRLACVSSFGYPLL
jgi:hypothetical protein